MPRAAERLQLRRRLRRQLRMREALLLDLGALVYELHRQGKRAPALLQQKASELSAVDHEVRGLQDALRAGDGLDRLQATGVMGSCASCGALLGPGDDYCARCGAAAWEEEAPAADDAPAWETEATTGEDPPAWEEDVPAGEDPSAWEEDAPTGENARAWETDAPVGEDLSAWAEEEPTEEAPEEDDALDWEEDEPAAERASAGDEAPAHDERPPS